MDPTDEEVLQRSPRDPDEPMLGRTQWRFVVLTGLLEAAATMAVFLWAVQSRDLIEARGLAFSTLVFGELFRAFAARSPTRIFWEVGAFTNLRLLGVVVASVLVQLGIHSIPATQAFFQIGPLPRNDAVLALAVGLCPVTVVEVQKLLRRALARRQGDLR